MGERPGGLLKTLNMLPHGNCAPDPAKMFAVTTLFHYTIWHQPLQNSHLSSNAATFAYMKFNEAITTSDVFTMRSTTSGFFCDSARDKRK